MDEDARAAARRFLEEETEFHLGMLPTEQAHPLTRGLAETLQQNTAEGIRMLQRVDRDVLRAAGRALAADGFPELVDAMVEAVLRGGRVCFSGCGATGRLSILLEACWRRACLRSAEAFPESADTARTLADRAWSIMTGGDYALIRSVENFEDFMQFGRRQVREAGIGAGDVLVGISEGGETSSVIGTVWEAHERGARTFFVFNNPAEILAAHIERSRRVIEHPAVVKLDLASGPMAVAGSTRMQATTAELLVVGAALELAWRRVMRERLPESARPAAPRVRSPQPYLAAFAGVLTALEQPAAVSAMAEWTEFERGVYARKGLITYFADELLLDIFTDTTERAPTFMLPPFRRCDDSVSPPSWAFVKNPLAPTPQTWLRALGREPRCLEWDASLYEQLGAPENIRRNPPRIRRADLMKFLIGNEPEPSRAAAPGSAAVLVAAAREWQAPWGRGPALAAAFEAAAAGFPQRAAVFLGAGAPPFAAGAGVFHVPVDVPESPLLLWDRLVAKLVLNTVSTATMGAMGRLVSNWMAHVETSNKKLVDRGTRLVAELAGVDYAAACYALHETMAELARNTPPSQPRPSPVAATIARLRRAARKN